MLALDSSSESPGERETSPAPATVPVGVVIPAFNAAGWIGEAIASARAQTMLPGEIIVVDDGSTDGTREIARGFGVRVIEQPKRGVSSARNLGARTSRMPWIAFLDADDLWLPDKLQRQFEALTAVPDAGMCFTGSVYFNARGYEGAGLSTIRLFRRVRRTAAGPPNVFACEPESFAAVLARVNFVVQSSFMVSRSIMLELGGYDENMALSEDLDFFLRVAAVTSAVLVDMPLTRVRLHENNTSRTFDRMILGDVGVGDAAQRAPERYPRGVPEAFAERRARRLLTAGIWMMRRAAVPEAVEAFDASIAERWSPEAASLAFAARCAATPVGRKALQAVRSVVALRRRPYG